MIKIDSPLYLTTQCFRLGSSKNYSSIGKEFVFAGVVGVRGGGRNTQESRILIHILKKGYILLSSLQAAHFPSN